MAETHTPMHPRTVLRIYATEFAVELERQLQEAADDGSLTSARALQLMADSARASHQLGYADGWREAQKHFDSSA